MPHSSVRSCQIRQGCRRKSYGGNHSLSVDYRNNRTLRGPHLCFKSHPCKVIMDNPFDKVFGGIRAGSGGSAYASMRHYHVPYFLFPSTSNIRVSSLLLSMSLETEAGGSQIKERTPAFSLARSPFRIISEVIGSCMIRRPQAS